MKTKRNLPGLVALAASSLLLAVPSAVQACPACLGGSDSPLFQGLNAGIFFLIGVIGAVLGGISCFFVYMVRRSRVLEATGIELEHAESHL